jgi:hypothetical protein
MHALARGDEMHVMHSRTRIVRPGIAAALSLREFVHRAKVLGMFRDFQRQLLGLDPAVAIELRAQVREGFRKHAGEKDRGNIKTAMMEGSRQLVFLRTYAGTSRWTKAGQVEDSWVGTGDPDDVKGRLGDFSSLFPKG